MLLCLWVHSRERPIRACAHKQGQCTGLVQGVRYLSPEYTNQSNSTSARLRSRLFLVLPINLQRKTIEVPCVRPPPSLPALPLSFLVLTAMSLGAQTGAAPESDTTSSPTATSSSIATPPSLATQKPASPRRRRPSTPAPRPPRHRYRPSPHPRRRLPVPLAA